MSTEKAEAFIGQEAGVRSQGNEASLFKRLMPILFVDDINAERDFYVSLGFVTGYQNQGPEFPDFVTITNGSIKFGIERQKHFSPETPNRVLTWRFGVRNIDAARQHLTDAGVRFREEWVTPQDGQKYRVLHARTPNGYHLFLEGPEE